MILSEIKTNSKGREIITQRIEIRCDSCPNEYESSLGNRSNGLLKYKKDLCRSCKQKVQYKEGSRKESWSKVNKRNIGKTLEERLGEEKAKLCKEKMSKSLSENNPRWSKKHRTDDEIKEQKENAKIIGDRLRGKTLEEIYGKEKAIIISKKLSLSRIGEKNPMYGKPSPKGSGNGWSGYYLDFYFRSLLELSYIHYLVENDINFENAEKKIYTVKYILNGEKRTYRPDFYLIDTNKIIEIKPSALVNSYLNKIKFTAAKNKFNNFNIITEKDINKLNYQQIKDLHNRSLIKFDKSTFKKFKKYENIK